MSSTYVFLDATEILSIEAYACLKYGHLKRTPFLCQKCSEKDEHFTKLEANKHESYVKLST